MSFSNNKQFIIYCMLRLWDEGRVDDWDFKSAWQKENLTGYKIWYYRYINEKQQQAIVV